MSDWVDLQLAHSLTPVQAPDALWARIHAPAAGARPHWRESFRWLAPCTMAVAMLLLLIRTTALELRPPHPEFIANDPAGIQHRLAHEATPVKSAFAETKSSLDSTVIASTRNDAPCTTCHSL